MFCNDIKAELSYAYVHAIAAKVGCECMRTVVDRDSIDVAIKAHGLYSATSTIKGVQIDLQLKATSAFEMREHDFSFELPVKNYNDLRGKRGQPALLVVLTMPEDEQDWLLHSESGLISKDCAYWHNLKSAPPVANADTKTVRVKRCNLFSPGTLRHLMTMVSKEEELGDVL